MSDVTIKYKGATIATMDATGSKTLGTAGKYCEGDIGVEYVKPAGPSGTKQISITQNGTTTEDVAAYANAEITVDVQGGGGITPDEMASRSGPTGAITLNESGYIAEHAFAGTPITSVNAPNKTGIRGSAFSGCSSLVSISFPEVSAFSHGNQHFNNCSALTSVLLPKCQTLANNAFQNCSSLEIVDLPRCSQLNYARLFYGDSKLSTIILRYTGGVIPLNGDALTGTPFAGVNGLTGTLFVPSALVEQYKTATNWATLYSGGTMQILPLEGSAYENTYADGTPIT